MNTEDRKTEKENREITQSQSQQNGMESMKHGRVLLQIIYHNLVRIQFRFFSFELHTLYVEARVTVYVCGDGL